MTATVVKLGNDYLLWVPDTATPPVYHALAGQGTATINLSQDSIDTSSKSTAGYATSAFGLAKLTVDLDVKVTLPDANGWTRMEALSLPGVQTDWPVEIRKNGAAAVEADAVFACLVKSSIQSVAFSQNGTVDAKLQFAASAAPTVFALA